MKAEQYEAVLAAATGQLQASLWGGALTQCQRQPTLTPLMGSDKGAARAAWL